MPLPISFLFVQNCSVAGNLAGNLAGSLAVGIVGSLVAGIVGSLVAGIVLLHCDDDVYDVFGGDGSFLLVLQAWLPVEGNTLGIGRNTHLVAEDNILVVAVDNTPAVVEGNTLLGFGFGFGFGLQRSYSYSVGFYLLFSCSSYPVVVVEVGE